MWILRIAFLTVVLAACSAAGPPASQTGTESTSSAGPDRACSSDEECILSTFPGCCSCCQCESLHALRADAEHRLQDSCSGIECAAQDCSNADCVPCAEVAAGVRAVCVQGLCSVVP